MNSVEKVQKIRHYLEKHDTKQARSAIEKLMQEEPDNVEVWYWRGVCEKLEGKLDLAENDFRRVIAKKPDHNRAFYGLGNILEKKGKLQEAIAAYQKAASLGNRQAAKKLAQYRPQEQPSAPKAANHSNKTVELKSEKGINYTQLQYLLASGQWQAADRETEKLMYRAAGINKARWGQIFPCTDLRTIDKLWTHYSQGRFGFSVQADIWRRRMEGGKRFNRIIWRKFGSHVGWFDQKWLCKSELSFDESAPKGHLPVTMWAPHKSEVNLNLLAAWWILQAKQKEPKDKKREDKWQGAALIDLLSRLESCKSGNPDPINQFDSYRSNQNKPQTIPSYLIGVATLIAAITGLLWYWNNVVNPPYYTPPPPPESTPSISTNPTEPNTQAVDINKVIFS